MKIFGILSLGALACGAILVASACGGSTTDTAGGSSTASQQSLDTLTARVQRNEVLSAWNVLENLPVHDMDTELQSGKIDGKYVPVLRTAIRELALTDWPPELQSDATKFHDDAVALFKAMNSGQTADQLKAQSSAVHEDADGFPAKAGDWAAKSLPADAGGPESSGGASTAAAGMTPAGAQ